MANKSNRELSEEALALGLQLGIEVQTEGLKNSQLVELVEGLTAKLTGAPPSPPVDGNAAGPEGGPPAGRPLEPPPARDAQEPPSRLVDGANDGAVGGSPKPAPTGPVLRYPYTVAEGKTLECRRGRLGAFAPVSSSDFSGGQEELNGLVAKGYVVHTQQPSK